MNLFNFTSDVHTSPRELNSTVNKLIYIPRVSTTTYGIKSISYLCATLWNEYFKKGEINVDEDEKNNVKLSKIKNKKKFQLGYEKALSSLIHYCTNCCLLLKSFYIRFSHQNMNRLWLFIVYCSLFTTVSVLVLITPYTHPHPPSPAPTRPHPLSHFCFF